MRRLRMSNERGSDRPASRRRAGTVRVWDEVAQPNRRAFLRLAAMQGASVPAAYFMLGGQGAAAASESAEGAATGATVRRKGAIRADREAGPKAGTIVRDFSNPRIEMIRLLREAAEVEHALMIQYLYAALSVKPAYHDLVGYGEPNTTDFLGVAIQEMQHLAAVNKLLVELGSPPHLERQDFPYEPDIYPFEFNLMPLSKRCSAMFMFTEAPAEALDRAKAVTPGGARADRQCRHDPRPRPQAEPCRQLLSRRDRPPRGGHRDGRQRAAPAA